MVLSFYELVDSMCVQCDLQQEEIRFGSFLAGGLMSYLVPWPHTRTTDAQRGSSLHCRVKLIIWSYWYSHIPWVISECPAPSVDSNTAHGWLQRRLNTGHLTLFCQFLPYFKDKSFPAALGEANRLREGLGQPKTSSRSLMTIPSPSAASITFWLFYI